ncbi:hypothetical protein DPEC_G00312960 [Dallia pectoralis]|uniref:Uncharacterized protein n=1 Tax=Dallia pectoralis TaxID=75939 RepID=A0ACC2FC21_DALPE|nr:hypothetical protein DPEC_G00312960 [Dallia pectoralis]
MFKVFTTFITILLSFLTEEVLSSPNINQTPPHLLRRTSEHKEARLDCFHGDNSYPYMLWYQQQDTSEQKTMELIGYLHYENPTMEKKFEPRFTLTGHSKANATLVISNISLSDSAVYYCAASVHSGAHSDPP